MIREIVKSILQSKITVHDGSKLVYGYPTLYTAKKLAKIELKRHYKGKELKSLLEELKTFEI